MNNAYLLTGSNIGDRASALGRAKGEIIEQCGKIMKSSSLYQTAAWGNTEQPAFLNQALHLQTLFSANELLGRLLQIEQQLGRRRLEKYGPRVIDIDILLFNQEIHQSAFLKIPHPELQNRRFALMPLAEIASSVIHPGLNKTIADLLTNCNDLLEVKKYTDLPT